MIFDYERRIQALEARVQALEDALKKERAAQVPDAQAQEKVTAQSSPAPAVQTPEKAPEQSLAAAAETREKTPEQSPAQQTVSAQLRAALDAPADPSCFQYMPEPGTATNGLTLYGAEHPKPERALQKLVGKGLRITAYTGFDAERVVIPAKIGRPQATADDIPTVFLRRYPAYKKKQLNVSELARVCDLSRTTVYKYIDLLEG